MAVIDKLLRLFACSIFSKVNALKRLELTANQRRRLRASITAEIRTCGGLIFPEVVSPEVSKGAQQEAERIGVLIGKMNWHNQSCFDPGRRTFHWDT